MFGGTIWSGSIGKILQNSMSLFKPARVGILENTGIYDLAFCSADFRARVKQWGFNSIFTSASSMYQRRWEASMLNST